MITVEAKKVSARVIANAKLRIGTGHYRYTVKFADEGSDLRTRPRRSASCADSGTP
jgi:hypothetical protein